MPPVAVQFFYMSTLQTTPLTQSELNCIFLPPEETNLYLLGIIKEIEPPFGRHEQPDVLKFIYTSPAKAQQAFDGLYEKFVACTLN